MKQATANLLDETKALEFKMRWQEFVYEQDSLLWGGTEKDWAPGLPLFQSPRERRAASMFAIQPRCVGCRGADDMPDWCTCEHGGGIQYTRNMYDLFDADCAHLLKHYKCQDCEVDWQEKWDYDTGDWAPQPCWICGVTRVLTKETDSKAFDDLPDDGPEVMRYSARDAAAVNMLYGVGRASIQRMDRETGEPVGEPMVVGPTVDSGLVFSIDEDVEPVGIAWNGLTTVAREHPAAADPQALYGVPFDGDTVVSFDGSRGEDVETTSPGGSWTGESLRRWLNEEADLRLNEMQRWYLNAWITSRPEDDDVADARYRRQMLSTPRRQGRSAYERQLTLYRAMGMGNTQPAEGEPHVHTVGPGGTVEFSIEVNIETNEEEEN